LQLSHTAGPRSLIHDSYGLLDHLNSNGFGGGFDYWSGRLLHFPCLGFALATVRFVVFPRAALDILRALPRVVATFLFCTFDCFLRLAMIRPVLAGGPQRIDAGSLSPGNPSNELSTDRSLSATTLAIFFLGRISVPL
jgi:hypothetical protein